MNSLSSLKEAEFLRVLAHCQTRRNQLKGRSFECYVVSRNLENFLEAVSSYSLKNEELLKIHVIYEEVMNSEFHFSSLYLEIDPKKRKAFMIDSLVNLNDTRHAQILFKNGFETIYSVDNRTFHPQNDCDSCSIFAFDFAAQNGKIDLLFEELENKPNLQLGRISYINWQDMKPGYLKFFQTRKFFNKFPHVENSLYKELTLKQTLFTSYEKGKNMGAFLKRAKFHTRIEKMLEDPSFEKRIEEIAKEDPIEVFKAIHSMK